jgi:uncharacterized protein YggT (Ycf19 family)
LKWCQGGKAHWGLWCFSETLFRAPQFSINWNDISRSRIDYNAVKNIVYWPMNSMCWLVISENCIPIWLIAFNFLLSVMTAHSQPINAIFYQRLEYLRSIMRVVPLQQNVRRAPSLSTAVHYIIALHKTEAARPAFRPETVRARLVLRLAGILVTHNDRLPRADPSKSTRPCWKCPLSDKPWYLSTWNLCCGLYRCHWRLYLTMNWIFQLATRLRQPDYPSSHSSEFVAEWPVVSYNHLPWFGPDRTCRPRLVLLHSAGRVVNAW